MKFFFTVSAAVHVALLLVSSTSAAFSLLPNSSSGARTLLKTALSAVPPPGTNAFSVAFAKSRDQAAMSGINRAVDNEIPAVRYEPIVFATFANQQRALYGSNYHAAPPSSPLQSAEEESIESTENLLTWSLTQMASLFGKLQGKTFGSPNPETWID